MFAFACAALASGALLILHTFSMVVAFDGYANNIRLRKALPPAFHLAASLTVGRTSSTTWILLAPLTLLPALNVSNSCFWVPVRRQWLLQDSDCSFNLAKPLRISDPFRYCLCSSPFQELRYNFHFQRHSSSALLTVHWWYRFGVIVWCCCVMVEAEGHFFPERLWLCPPRIVLQTLSSLVENGCLFVVPAIAVLAFIMGMYAWSIVVHCAKHSVAWTVHALDVNACAHTSWAIISSMEVRRLWHCIWRFSPLSYSN